MPELRKDPVVGRWVIIATERARRPSDFVTEPVRPRASATKSEDSRTSRPRPRRSWRIMSHQTHRSLRSKYWAEPASSSATMIGMIGVAMSCECGCSSEAPAASPWFLNTRTYANRGSFLRSSMRSRNANKTSATASTERPAREASCRGVSMTTSWAPTPFIRSKRPSPDGSSSPSIRSAGNLFGTTR